MHTAEHILNRQNGSHVRLPSFEECTYRTEKEQMRLRIAGRTDRRNDGRSRTCWQHWVSSWRAKTPPPTLHFGTSWPAPMCWTPRVVVDGNITTSYGLGGAIPFALELVRQLAGEAEADRIRNAIASALRGGRLYAFLLPAARRTVWRTPPSSRRTAHKVWPLSWLGPPIFPEKRARRSRSESGV